MEEPTAQPGTAPTRGNAPLPRRLGAGFMRLNVRRLASIKVEDMALAGGYFALFWLLDAVNLTAFGSLKVEQLASAWPAIALLGCFGVLFRRTSAAAMGWMCSLAAAGLLLAGHAGAFILVFELFFSLVLFGSARVSTMAARAAWVISAVLLVAAYAASRDAGLTVAAGFMAVLTLLTPVEWAGNLRKANLLAESESARADAVHDAGRQRLLAERNAHDLALEQDRQHMARELHDVISARLSAIALQSGAALHSARDAGQAGPGTELLRQIRQESVAGLDELNTMIRLLHSGESSEAPGQIAELEPLIEAHRTAGMSVDFSNSMHDGGHLLPLPVQTTVYRTASESLANAAKHAPGKPVEVSLAVAPSAPGALDVGDKTGQELTLSVRSILSESPAGSIPGAKKGTGTGLPSMHFRAAHAGGTLTAGPQDGHWSVVLTLPVPVPASATEPATTANTDPTVSTEATINTGPAVSTVPTAGNNNASTEGAANHETSIEGSRA